MILFIVIMFDLTSDYFFLHGINLWTCPTVYQVNKALSLDKARELIKTVLKEST